MFKFLCLLLITFLVAVEGYSSESSKDSSSGTGGRHSWHRQSRYYRSSSYEDHDHYRNRCRSIRRDCDDEDNCAYPTIQYYHDHGKRRAVVSCPNKKFAYLTTSDGEVLMNGMNGDKIVHCGSGKSWYAKDINGGEVDFKTLRCIFVESNTDEE